MAKYNNSRFYWLQLKENFFDEDAIDWLEDQPNGKEYSLFYLKLCLKSLRTNGMLIRKVGELLIPYDHIKLGELTKTNPDTVIVAMELLQKIGLVKKLENGELYMTEVEKMIGSQSVGAFKKQQQRITNSAIKEIESGQRVDKCPPDIDIELDKDIDKDININKEDISKDISKKKKITRFIKPTIEEIKSYCDERKNNIDPEYFFNYNEARGWMLGKIHMKDWKATIRTWERLEKEKNENSQPKQEQKNQELKGLTKYQL